MKTELIRDIQKHILELKSFKEEFDSELIKTEHPETPDEELDAMYYDSFFGWRVGGEVIILDETSTNMEMERTFYLYHINDDRLVKASEEEDNILRDFDDRFVFREMPEMVDIISRNWKNEIDFYMGG